MTEKTLPLLATRLDEALAVAEPTPDDLYELALAVAQAVRVHRASKPGAAALASAIARGRAMLASESATTILASLDAGALLDQLEDQLDDLEGLPEPLFAVLVDVDEHAAAATLLGQPQAAATLLRDAETLLRVHNDGALRVQGLAAAYRTARGIADDEPAAALWRAIAEAEPEGALVPEPLLPSIAALIAAESARTTARILTFRLPLKRVEAAVEPLRVAASAGDLPVPPADEVARDPDGRWQVVVLRRGVRPELAVLADPDEKIEVFAEVDGQAVPLQDDGDGARSVVLRPEATTWRLHIDGQIFELTWADAP